MSFVTDAEVLTSVAAALHQDTDDLPDWWSVVIADANLAAYNQIQVHFLTLGFSQAAIDAWDQGPTFQKFLARYQALMDGSGDRDQGLDQWRIELDYWRGQLAALLTLVTDGGIDPGTGNDVVGHGDLSTRNDEFVRNPHGRGHVTQW